MKYIIFAFILFFSIQLGYCKSGTTIKMAYSAPFKQGDDIWNQFKTAKERILALQIPDSVITQIPTEQLLELCLAFPYITDMYAFDDSQKGVEYLISEYNGFGEFLKRDNVIDALLKKYSKIELAVPFLQKASVMEKGNYSFQCDLLVKLIRLINKRKGTKQINEFFLNQTEKNLETIKKYPELFGSMCKAALNQFNPKADIKPSALSGGEEYLSDLEGNIYKKSTRKTHLGFDVVVEILQTEDYDSIDAFFLKNRIAENYNVKTIGPATRKYNGHGLAWHMSDNLLYDAVWIGLNSSEDEDVYRESGSYYSVPPAEATHILYSNEHTTVKRPDGKYWSKWSTWPLIEYDGTETLPFVGTPIGFYKKFTPVLTGEPLFYPSQTYSINPLPTGYSVEWKLSDSYYNQHCLQQSYPAPNQCTITYSNGHYMINATLTATIKYKGNTILTLTKTVGSYDDIHGQYTSDNLSGTIDGTHKFYVKPNVISTITSPMFQGALVSYDYDGTIPTTFNFSVGQRKLYFTMPANNNGKPVIINVEDFCGNHYKLYAMPYNSYYMNIAYGDGNIDIELKETVTEDSKSEALKTMKTADDQTWQYEIWSSASGTLKVAQTVSSRSTTISTVGWPKGVYIIKAKIGKEEVTEKIVVK